jgi:hypothetical protein
MLKIVLCRAKLVTIHYEFYLSLQFTLLFCVQISNNYVRNRQPNSIAASCSVLVRQIVV